MLTSVPLMFLNSILSYMKPFTTFDVSSISIASVNLDDNSQSLFGIFHFVVAVIHMIFTFGFVARILYLSRLTLKEDIESTKTLEISKIPNDLTDEKELREIFEKYFKNEEIKSINIAYVLDELKLLVDQKQELEELHLNLLSIQENKSQKKWYQCFRSKHVKSKMLQCELDLKEINQKIEIEQMKPLVGSGIAFVTFHERSFAKECMQMKMDEGFETQYAAHPSSILWKNLKYSSKDQSLRFFVVYAVSIFLFGLVCGIGLTIQSLTTINELFQVPLSKFYLESGQIIKSILYVISFVLDVRGILSLMMILTTIAIIGMLVKHLKKHSMTSELKSNARGMLFFLVIS
jgi:hypothetical protein